LRSLHHTGPVLKEQAAKLYSNMNRNEKIEEFLEHAKNSSQGVMGFGKSVRYWTIPAFFIPMKLKVKYHSLTPRKTEFSTIPLGTASKTSNVPIVFNKEKHAEIAIQKHADGASKIFSKLTKAYRDWFMDQGLELCKTCIRGKEPWKDCDKKFCIGLNSAHIKDSKLGKLNKDIPLWFGVFLERVYITSLLISI
jgi:hypothetical protein